jgi:hypothetical protein
MSETTETNENENDERRKEQPRASPKVQVYIHIADHFTSISSCSSMALRYRLSREEVELIFDCVAKNLPPTNELSFKIISSVAGSKISPPPFEYEDGIYVILTAADKKTFAPTPSALMHLVLPTSNLEKLPTCHWRSSGKKSHKTNNPQSKYLVRYCYPQSEGYRNTKGASVWTQRDERGFEILHVRVLHIYSLETTMRVVENSSERPLKMQRVAEVPKVETAEVVEAPIKAAEAAVAPVFDIRCDLMKEELIATPIREDSCSVNLAPVDPESLFNFDDNDDEDNEENQSPLKTVSMPTPSRISMSPQSNLISFGNKIKALANDIQKSQKEDRGQMIRILEQQLEILTTGVDSNDPKTNSNAKVVRI